MKIFNKKNFNKVNHIKTINELLKSTYKSASDKLKIQHPSRADKLMKHADDFGDSELTKLDLDRDFPHAFKFNIEDVREYLLGKFYIIGASDKTDLRTGYYGVMVEMLNDWGQNVLISVSFSDIGDFNQKIKFGKNKSFERSFLFDNRKDALAFKGYLIEKYDSGELDCDISSLGINKFYSTN